MLQNKKNLGQNWLKNRKILNYIADLAAFGAEKSQDLAIDHSSRAEKPTEKVSRRKTQVQPRNASKSLQTAQNAKKPLCLEVGPGLGTLTSSLLKRFEKVVAVEFDEKLAKNLPGSFPGTNLEVIHADILSFDFEKLKKPYVIAGNIPYNITSPLIKKVITLKNPPERIVFLVQKEVAERIALENSSFSLFVQNFATPELGLIVKKTEFTPVPKVDSRVLILTPHPAIVSANVLKTIKIGFSSPRKKLIHNFKDPAKTKLALEKLRKSPDSRPADLNLSDWQVLYNLLTTDSKGLS